MAAGVRHLKAEAFDAFGAPVSVWEVVYAVFVKLGLRRQHWRSLDTSGLYFLFCTLDNVFDGSLLVLAGLALSTLFYAFPQTTSHEDLVGNNWS